ncbi:hybrid sensor histidine kinase/response regulator [Azospirillum griseum]|uniref:hybrid sensor histidine kinase/response regulator n=1 Tax=Azospirillum griseum TaxID=2496639 RepID=UPI0013154368|nr:hybrid sensor histidine kinase/response regulator [Azospirillum griseum]
MVSGAVALAVLVTATAQYILMLRDKEIDAAKRELATLNLSLAEQTARSIQNVDLVLTSMIDQMKAEGIATPQDMVRLRSDQETHDLLKAKASVVPQIDAVMVVGADGQLLNFSRFYPAPNYSVADRDFFQALKDTPTDQPFLGEPVQNRATGGWTVHLARRVSAANGRFLGLAVGAIDLDYFQRLYRGLRVGDTGSSISLWRRDGILLARHPALPGIGKPLGPRRFLDVLTESEAGEFVTPDGLDATARVVATRAVNAYPVVVNVTRTLDDVLQGWRAQVMTLALAGLVGALALLLALWALARQFRAYETAALALAETRRAMAGREQAELALRQAQKMEAVGQLTGGVAHDFNNLLQALSINLHVLESRCQDERLALPIRMALQAVERGSTLTQHLLAFSRRQPLRPELVDVAALVAGVAALMARTLGGVVRVEHRADPGLWPVMIDPNQLEMALINLAINARDAMPDGGVLCLEAGNHAGNAPRQPGVPSGDGLCITVRDTGTGMTPEVLSRATEPFFTTKEVGRGTGLGLAMVQSLANRSGGGLVIDSQLGHGTTVRLFLPRANPDAVAAPPPGASTGSEADSACSILLVDDEDLVRGATADFLTQAGFAVQEAADAETALRLLERGAAVDVIVTDHMMPGMNGLDMVRAIRARNNPVPILMVTGFAEELRTDVAGVSDGLSLLAKPVVPQSLVRSIRAMASMSTAA